MKAKTLKKYFEDLDKQITDIKAEIKSIECIKSIDPGLSYSKICANINMLKSKLAYIETERCEPLYASQIWFTDVVAYEVIERITPNKFIVRRLKAVETKDSVERRKKSFQAGGFAGHVDDDLQEYSFESDPCGTIVELRRHKDGKFGRGNERWILTTEPFEKYDFNF